MLRSANGVVELRQYTLQPGRRDELIDLFEREFVESQEALGMELLGTFRDARRGDRFVWLRAFPDMESRKQSLTEFYEGPVWQEHRNAANATMIDSDNVLLLRPTGGVIPNPCVRPPLLAVTYFDSAQADVAAIERAGGTILESFETETSPNTFPRLPVREDVRVRAFLTSGVAPESLPNRENADVVELVPTPRSRIQLAFTGRPGDFDFLNGEWTVTHRRLSERLHGCTEWVTFTGSARHESWCGGVVSVDEIDLPGMQSRGCSIRNLDVAAQRWSIHWTTNRTGNLFPPVHGGFDGDRGEFYGPDVENGVPVLARFVWSGRGTEAPRWEQAFSTDGGRAWETNWIMEFARRRGSE
ncbi:MAG TPA: NIPSNAP family protein [Candidatus Baltobacteraceae bacterium]|nr:NIPSNAP family protein [Candidatus Baltobacteraceae bacterium]